MGHLDAAILIGMIIFVGGAVACFLSLRRL